MTTPTTGFTAAPSPMVDLRQNVYCTPMRVLSGSLPAAPAHDFGTIMQKPLLDILCCPATRAGLRLASATEVAAVNDAIAAGGLINAGGDPVHQRLSAALVTVDATRVYRIDDDIPVLLADEAILAASVASFAK